jgi:2-keto-3-deoxy-galactonokinase
MNPEEAVDRLLDELPLLSEYETLIMAQLWSDEDDEARRRAWQRAKPAIRRTGLNDVLDRARDEVATWMRASQADFAGLAGLLGREGGHVSARQSAAPAVLDAIAATLAQRELHSADYDLLLRPWQRALEAGEQAADETVATEQASD